MPGAAADFQAGDDIKRIPVALLISPEARIKTVVIGNGNNGEVRASQCDEAEKFGDGRFTIAGSGVHVQIGVALGLHIVDVPFVD